MGGFEDVDEAILAGAKIGDADIASDAGIKPLKVKKRSVFIPIPISTSNMVFTGASVAVQITGVFARVLFPNANSGTLTTTVMSPIGETSPGDIAKLHIWWITPANSGSARFVIDIKPAIETISGLGSAIQKAIIGDARASANQFIDTIIEFPAAVFTTNQLIGLKIERDPSNSLDDLGDSAFIGALYLEMQGRC